MLLGVGFTAGLTAMLVEYHPELGVFYIRGWASILLFPAVLLGHWARPKDVFYAPYSSPFVPPHHEPLAFWIGIALCVPVYAFGVFVLFRLVRRKRQDTTDVPKVAS